MNGTKLGLRALQNAPVILLILVFIVFSILSPNFFSYQNLENVLIQASYIGIIGVGMTFVLLTAGVDLSVGSNMYVSTVIVGIYLLGHGVPAWLGVLATVAIGLLIGIINAIVITRFHVIPFVVTFGMLFIARGIGLSITQSAVVSFPNSILALGSERLFGLIPWPIVIFAVIVLIAHLTLTQTTYGRQVYAVGNDVEAAKKAGINTRRIIASVYLIGGVCAAIGGLISVAQLGVASPTFGQNREFDAIAIAVIDGTSLFGGRGSVFPGTVLGAVLIQLINAGLIFLNVDIYLQPIVYALIIFLIVLLDSLRTTQLAKLERRNIRRVEKG
jgi:ribose/xylose/arabinose/galactoside ABC-type transport system permease subunit